MLPDNVEMIEQYKLGPDDYWSDWAEGMPTPAEIWGFRTPPDQRSTPRQVADTFLSANRALLGIKAGNQGLEFDLVISGLGGHHVIYRQVVQAGDGSDIPIANGSLTVHMDRQNRVYMCRCGETSTHMKPAHQPVNFKRSEAEAIVFAKHLLNTDSQDGLPTAIKPVGDANMKVLSTKKIMYGYMGRLYAGYRVRISILKPREEWDIYIQADEEEMYFFDANQTVASAPAAPKARVFDPHPIAHAGDYKVFINQPMEQYSAEDHIERLPIPKGIYKTRSLKGLTDKQLLKGEHVDVRVGRGRKRLRRRDGDFLCYATASGEKKRGFEEVMTYYHIDNAIRYLEKLGFKNDAAVFKKPIIANVYQTDRDAAWYNARTRQLYFGYGGVSECEDAEVILHELGHAISEHISRNFARGLEARAVSEGFSDYFAASYFYDKKPDNLKGRVMSWDGLTWGLKRGMNPPCVRVIDVPAKQLTMNDFNYSDSADEHINGIIWGATLWDIHRFMRRLYGKAGREMSDRIIIDGLFELSNHTTVFRAARGIINADRNLNFDDNKGCGKHETELIKIFKSRNIPTYF